VKSASRGFGTPIYTLARAARAARLQQNMIVNAYPGLLDVISRSASMPTR